MPCSDNRKQFLNGFIATFLISLLQILFSGLIENTGHFIMYSRITKINGRKTIGHVFTKPVQIEGTTQKVFFQKVVFHRSSHFCC
jgi:hypothetical protein